RSGRPVLARTEPARGRGPTRCLPSGLSPSVLEFHQISRPLVAVGSRTVTAGSEFHRPRSAYHHYRPIRRPGPSSGLAQPAERGTGVLPPGQRHVIRSRCAGTSSRPSGPAPLG